MNADKSSSENSERRLPITAIPAPGVTALPSDDSYTAMFKVPVLLQVPINEIDKVPRPFANESLSPTAPAADFVSPETKALSSSINPLSPKEDKNASSTPSAEINALPNESSAPSPSTNPIPPKEDNDSSPTPSAEINALPDDPRFLKGVLYEASVTIKEKDKLILYLSESLAKYKQKQYGTQSERYVPDPNDLFPNGEQPSVEFTQPPSDESPPDESPPTDPKPNSKKKCRKHGRRRLPENLERKRVVIDLTSAEKVCPGCGQERCCIGEDCSEHYEFVPASIFILVKVRPKYACPRCKNTVVSQSLNSHPLDNGLSGPAFKKGLPGPGLLAFVLTNKFTDHLPLYRQVAILARYGVLITKQTMGDWVGQAVDLLIPLYEVLKNWVLQSEVMATDDTHVMRQHLIKTIRTRIWFYGGDRKHPCNFFDYTKSRNRDGPTKVLANFRGYLQADAFTGYDRIYVGDQVIEVGCNAHARRKFFESKGSDSLHAHIALGFYRQLYAIEAAAKKNAEKRYRAEFPNAPPLNVRLPPARYLEFLYEERIRLRTAEAVPLLQKFHDWLKEQKPLVLPKSPIAEAFTYCLNQWEALKRYTTSPILEIDNNWAEQEMKRIAIGRKNWLFFGSDRGGERAAIIYSFTSTCFRHRIDPFVYLRDIFRRLPTHPKDRLEELLPGNWQPWPEPTYS